MMKPIITFVAILIALGMLSDKAQAHTIPLSKCYSAAKAAGPYQSYRWKVALRKCKRYRKQHAWNHRCGGTVKTIKCVFGRHGDEAVRVARCESGLDTGAINGQYYGLFQMGVNERATYGDGRTALLQSQAAHRYFLDAGWRPWSCQP